MNETYFVPLNAILNFPKIKQLTTKMEDLVEAIQDSEHIILNDSHTMIKPNIKVHSFSSPNHSLSQLERKTIILREIPKDVPEEEIKKIFEGLGEIQSIRSDVGDTWYFSLFFSLFFRFVTLESETVAIHAVQELQNRTFRDQHIKARLKSENLLRSIYKPPMSILLFFLLLTVLDPVIPSLNSALTKGLNPIPPAPFLPPAPAFPFMEYPLYFGNPVSEKPKKYTTH